MIRFNTVSKTYHNGLVAINNVSLTINHNALICLTGPAAAGKSTLLKLIAAIETPSQGEIIVAGKKLSHLSQRGIAKLRRSIGIAPQHFAFLHDSTLLENVSLPLSICGYSYQERKKLANIALEKVGLTNKEKSYPHMLSAGELQLANLARAIVNLPQIILVDELTSNMDAANVTKILNLFINLSKAGSTILITTNNLKFAAAMQHCNATLININHGHLKKYE